MLKGISQLYIKAFKIYLANVSFQEKSAYYTDFHFFLHMKKVSLIFSSYMHLYYQSTGIQKSLALFLSTVSYMRATKRLCNNLSSITKRVSDNLHDN